MKTLGFAVLAVIGGYLVGLCAGMALIEAVSSNTHDKSLEAAMTGAFVLGPLTTVVAVSAILVVRVHRAQSVPTSPAVSLHHEKV